MPDLPPEIWNDVFRYVGADYHDIANCRLVGRDFNTLSSPFLITRLVLARRVNVLRVARAIGEHPVFRKSVTEILLDLSEYDYKTAYSQIEFYWWCQDFGRTFKDHEWKEAQEQRLFNPEALLNPSIEGQPGCCVQPSPGEGTIPVEVGPSDHARVLDEIEEEARQRSLRIARALYRSHYDNECKMRAECALTTAVLHALECLPNLRKLWIGDWTNLVPEGEIWNALSLRLFRDTMPPGTTDNPWCQDDVRDIMPLLEARLDSHQISCVFIGECQWAWTQAHPFRELEKNAYRHSRPRELSLSIVAQPHRAHDYQPFATSLCSFLGTITGNITQLAIGIGQLRSRSPMCNPKIFSDFVRDVTMPRLKRVCFQKWKLGKEDLQRFLCGHRDTLRELRLLDCVVPDRHGTVALAQWAGEELHLTGVEFGYCKNMCNPGAIPLLDDPEV